MIKFIIIIILIFVGIVKDLCSCIGEQLWYILIMIYITENLCVCCKKSEKQYLFVQFIKSVNPLIIRVNLKPPYWWWHISETIIAVIICYFVALSMVRACIESGCTEGHGEWIGLKSCSTSEQKVGGMAGQGNERLEERRPGEQPYGMRNLRPTVRIANPSRVPLYYFK